MKIDPQLPASPKTPEQKRLLSACKDFEAVFINQLFQTMRPKLDQMPGQSLFGSSFERDTYNSMYFEAVSKTVAKGRGLGLAQAMYRQLAERVKNGVSGKIPAPVDDTVAREAQTSAAFSRKMKP
jgi:flagellar protein FlgJ